MRNLNIQSHNIGLPFSFLIGVMINSSNASTSTMFNIISALILICTCALLGLVGILLIRSIIVKDDD